LEKDGMYSKINFRELDQNNLKEVLEKSKNKWLKY
jgi:hypothetical protein